MRTFEFEHVRSFCLSKPHVTESFPFDDHTMVWKVADKVFAIANIYDFKGVSLKCNPERALELRETYAGIRPGFHLNKKHWIFILKCVELIVFRSSYDPFRF